MKLKEIDVAGYQEIIDKYKVNSLIGKVVMANAYNQEKIATFFNPKSEIVYKEEIFKPIKDKLIDIKNKRLKVFVFGDYDCDGICATTIMVNLLNKLQIDNGYYIPNRLTEGYGLNIERLKQAYEKGYRVLITVDNGISAQEPLKWAKEHNMIIILTDHHLIEKDVMYDYLLHPSLLQEDYKYLSGAAVVYMLASYLKVDDDKDIILACLSIISDCMSLLGINVSIVSEGLRLLNNHCYPCLEMLDKMNYPINEYDLSFQIIPKINAVGRLSDIANANNVVKFLLSSNENDAKQYARWLISINSQRQVLSNKQYEMICEKIDNNKKIIFICSDKLHDGIIGLLASKIAARFNKIVFIGSIKESNTKISARSVSDIDIMEFLEDYKDNFIDIGGHKKACGFSINNEKLQEFAKYLDDKSEYIDYQQEFEYINVDDLDLTYDNIKELFKYRPFGQERKIPLVRYHVDHPDSYSYLRNEHQLKWQKNNIEFISFENEGYQHYLDKDIDIIANIKENKFNGRINYQLQIVSFIEHVNKMM